MTPKNMIMVRGKYRYGKPTEQEALQWDASASRLKALMEMADIKQNKICKLSEESENVIHKANLSDYKNAKRGLTPKHLDFISRILFDALKEMGYDYNFDVFKLYLSGMEPTCDNYQEFEKIANNNTELNTEKYKSLFNHAGFIIEYNDGFYSINDNSGNNIECGYDAPEYSVYYKGKLPMIRSDVTVNVLRREI